MTTIYDNLEVLKLEQRRPEWQGASFNFTLDRDDLTAEPCRFGFKRTYRLTGKIVVEFSANNAQFEDAVNNAKKLLASRLFSPALALVQEIRSATFDQDDRRIMALCGELEDYFSAI